MIDDTRIKISKLVAAKRQLETAIKLYFYDADIISIYALAAAAHQILNDIGKSKGTASLFNDENIRPEKKKEWHALVAKPQNFFKHADKDPNGYLDFAPEGTELMLITACTAYRQLTQENPVWLMAFNAWLAIQKPDVFIWTEENKVQFEKFIKSTGKISKQQILEWMFKAEKTIQ